MSFDAHGAGTPPSVWEQDSRLARAAEADLADVRELVVIAAHPDDETLGAGGLIALAGDRGVPVHIVVVTDGAASHPDSPTTSADRLRVRRRDELREAVGRLSAAARITWMGYPDGRAAEFVEQITERLRVELAAGDPRPHVAVVWSHDGHGDHDVIGRIAEGVAPPGATVWSYPIWMWHWAHPDDAVLPWVDARVLSLPPSTLERKRDATSAFVSQLEPLSAGAGDERVLEPAVLEHFDRDCELYFVTRAGSR